MFGVENPSHRILGRWAQVREAVRWLRTGWEPGHEVGRAAGRILGKQPLPVM